MLTSIKDRSVIVTGASKGIGKGIAKVFAAQGAKVMIAARGEDDLKAAADEISGAGGIELVFGGNTAGDGHGATGQPAVWIRYCDRVRYLNGTGSFSVAQRRAFDICQGRRIGGGDVPVNFDLIES